MRKYEARNRSGLTVNFSQPVNRNHALNRGLVSWWKVFPHWRGTQFRDIAGKNHGTLTNGPTWTGALGRPGGHGAIQFDGSNDYVDALASSAMLLNVLSAACWVYVTSAQTNKGVISLCDFSTHFGWNSLLLAAGGVRVEVETTGFATAITASITSAWTHFGFTYDGATIQTYLNGKADASAAQTGNINYGTGTKSLRLGTRFAGESAACYIDDARYWSRALSASEFWSLYEDSRRGNPTTLNYIQRATVFDVGGGAPATGARARYMPLLGAA